MVEEKGGKAEVADAQRGDRGEALPQQETSSLKYKIHKIQKQKYKNTNSQIYKCSIYNIQNSQYKIKTFYFLMNPFGRQNIKMLQS